MKKRNLMLIAVLVGFIVALSFSGPSDGADEPKDEKVIAVSQGNSVKVNYTLKVDGEVVDFSSGGDPLEFKAGSHQLIPGFENAVMGMKVGEKKSFSVSPAEGYGPVNPEAIRDVPLSQLPPDIEPKPGMVLYAQGADGQRLAVKVVEVKEDVVVMDFNHPLAGKTLNFDVEVVGIQ